MSTTPKDGGHAFPSILQVNGIRHEQTGMTLRDWFAGQALAGLLANPTADSTFDAYTRASYKIADAMIAAREKGAEA